MTAGARRAAPPAPGLLQRLAARFDAVQRVDQLEGQLADYVDELDRSSRQAGGSRSTVGIQYADTARRIRSILEGPRT